MIISLVDKSTHFKGRQDVVAAIARAVDRQLGEEVTAAYGYKTALWHCAHYSAAPPAASYTLALFDDADAAGALGYHDLDPNGRPYGKVFVSTILDNHGTELGPDLSVSVTVSHEALEIVGDPGANYWAQMPDGRLTAHELCDAVEGDSYQHTSTEPHVSNFLLPYWFRVNDGESKKFDYLGKLHAPFTMTPGGYMIVMRQGRVSQVFAEAFPEWKKASKQHPAARTARRQSHQHD